MQIIVLIVITGGVYLGITFLSLKQIPLLTQTDLPQVDDALLGGTAVSHGTYLLKKISSRPGQG